MSSKDHENEVDSALSHGRTPVIDERGGATPRGTMDPGQGMDTNKENGSATQKKSGRNSDAIGRLASPRPGQGAVPSPGETGRTV